MEAKLQRVRPLGSTVASSSTDQEVPDSITGSIVGLFSSGELLRGVYWLDVSVSKCPLLSFDHRLGEVLQLSL